MAIESIDFLDRIKDISGTTFDVNGISTNGKWFDVKTWHTEIGGTAGDGLTDGLVFRAEDSEAEAKLSELAAAASETAAGASETAASNSETAAGLSETAAGFSETASGLSETAAAASALASSNSATAALASEDASAASESASAVSAAEALASETAAGLSETSAGVSEVNADLSETAAGVSEVNALSSETAAGLSETSANASEVASGLSETAAGLSEAASAASAVSASTSAIAADASETAAELSATAALASEAAASASETAAGVSETNAGLSKTAAGVSETNASNSETAAGLSETAAGLSETASEASSLLSQDWATKETAVIAAVDNGGVALYSARKYANDALSSKEELTALTADATDVPLVPGTNTIGAPTASYNSSTGILSLGIPHGKMLEMVSITPQYENGVLNGKYSWVFTDGFEYTTEDITGDTGATGPVGDNEEVTGFTSNGDGTYNMTFKYGTTQTTDSLTGPTGPTGSPGVDVKSTWWISNSNGDSAGTQATTDTYGVYSTVTQSSESKIGEFDVYNGANGNGAGDMLYAQNLEFLADMATARTNIGVDSSSEVTAKVTVAVPDQAGVSSGTVLITNGTSTSWGYNPNIGSW